MSDIFFNNEDQRKRKNEYIESIKNEVRQKDDERLQNRQRYGVELTDEQYSQINNLIADSDNYDEEAHKIGSAILYSKQFNIPVDEAYAKVDDFSEALWGIDKPTSYRNLFTVIGDMLTIGNNGLKLGNLGNKLREAEYNNDTEYAEQLLKEIETLNKDNELRQDNAPRTWATEAIKLAAQTLPFSTEAAGLGLFGNFLVPGLGTAMAFGSSSSLAAGQEYLDMRQQGVSAETARKVAAISGGLQGLAEVALGTTTSYLAAGAGKKFASTAAGKIADKVAENLAKTFHYGAGRKLAVKLVTDYTADKLGEGLEEAVQELTSIVSQDVARSMDGLGLDDKTIAEKTKQIADAFAGGVVGAVVLGLPFDFVKTKVGVKEYKKVKETAQEMPSEEIFKNMVKDNPVFKDLKEEDKGAVIHEVWENIQNEKEAEEIQAARERAESTGADETFEEEVTDEETGETEAQPVARTEEGKLYTEDDTVSEDENIRKGSFRVGDNSKESKNNYGYINYTVDEDQKTVTIDKLLMSKQRKNLQQEMFEAFAEKYAGYDIQWNPVLDTAKAEKQELINNNPSGKNNGLNYFGKETVANIEAKKMIDSQIRQVIKKLPSMTNQEYNEQIAGVITVLEAAGKKQGKSLSQYFSDTYDNRLFGTEEEYNQLKQQKIEALEKQGKFEEANQIRNEIAAGTVYIRRLGRQVKGLIFAAKTADFSTVMHEFAHVFQEQLEGDLKTEAEAAFGVKTVTGKAQNIHSKMELL